MDGEVSAAGHGAVDRARRYDAGGMSKRLAMRKIQSANLSGKQTDGTRTSCIRGICMKTPGVNRSTRRTLPTPFQLLRHRRASTHGRPGRSEVVFSAAVDVVGVDHRD